MLHSPDGAGERVTDLLKLITEPSKVLVGLVETLVDPVTHVAEHPLKLAHRLRFRGWPRNQRVHALSQFSQPGNPGGPTVGFQKPERLGKIEPDLGDLSGARMKTHVDATQRVIDRLETIVIVDQDAQVAVELAQGIDPS